MAHEHSPRGRTPETPGTVLPLLSMMLLGMDAKVSQCGEAAVAQVADVVLRLIVHSHVIGDVGRREQLSTYMTRDFLFVTNHMCTQPILRSKARLTGRTFERSLG